MEKYLVGSASYRGDRKETEGVRSPKYSAQEPLAASNNPPAPPEERSAPCRIPCLTHTIQTEPIASHEEHSQEWLCHVAPAFLPVSAFLLAGTPLRILQLRLPHFDPLPLGFTDNERATTQVFGFIQLVFRQSNFSCTYSEI